MVWGLLSHESITTKHTRHSQPLMPATTLPNSGTKPFRIVSAIGESSHSSVKLAEHPGVRKAKNHHEEELVVIKTIHDFSLKRNYYHSADFVTLRSIECHIAALRRLRHPNIVQLYETIDDPTSNQMHFVMQYAKHRRPLMTVASADGTCQRFGEAAVVGIVARLVSALRYLHRNGFVHGALKPSNILVDNDGSVHLTDVGGSHWLFVPPASVLHHATTSHGSPQSLPVGPRTNWAVLSSRGGGGGGGYACVFTAPEVWTSQGNVAPSAASDVWSLGVLMLSMLGGRVPQQLVDVLLCARRQGAGATTTMPTSIAVPMPSGVSVLAKDCLTRMLHVDPRHRVTLEELKVHAFFTQQRSGDGGQVLEEEASPGHTESLEGSTSFRRFANPDIYSSDTTAHTLERARSLSPMEDDSNGTGQPPKRRAEHATWVAALIAHHTERRAAAKLRRLRVVSFAVRFAIRLSRVQSKQPIKQLAYCNSFYGVVPEIVVDAPPPPYAYASSELSVTTAPSPPCVSKQLRSPRSRRGVASSSG